MRVGMGLGGGGMGWPRARWGRGTAEEKTQSIDSRCDDRSFSPVSASGRVEHQG